MKNGKLNFDLNFLNTPDTTPNGNIKNDWGGILSCIDYLPTKVLLQHATPLNVSKSKILIGFKSKNLVGIINSNNKLQYLVEACNKFYKQNNSNVEIIWMKGEQTNYKNTSCSNESVSDADKTDDSGAEDELASESKEYSFTKIKYNEKDSINWKLIIIVSIGLLVVGFISFGVSQDKKRNAEIAQIKNNAYEYLKNNDEVNFNKELNKLSNYGIENTQIKEELKEQYKDEVDRILSDIAYNYENNRTHFEFLKYHYLPILFKNNEDLFNQAVESKLGYKELSLKQVALPKSGVLHNYTGKEAIAPFEIITQASDNNDPLGLYNDNYYIKLVNPYTDKTEVVIFIHGGETIKMHVPLGTYKIKRASGTKWYGEDYLFGHNTQYTASDELLTFQISGSYVEGHTLTLYKVEDGNFSTKDISAEEF